MLRRYPLWALIIVILAATGTVLALLNKHWDRALMTAGIALYIGAAGLREVAEE